MPGISRIRLSFEHHAQRDLFGRLTGLHPAALSTCRRARKQFLLSLSVLPITSRHQFQNQRTLFDRLRVEYAIEKPNNKLRTLVISSLKLPTLHTSPIGETHPGMVAVTILPTISLLQVMRSLLRRGRPPKLLG
jgi:hypothetical protein